MSSAASAAQCEKQELGGYFMEYPTLEEVREYTRELSFEERISVISQGYHRGVSIIRCYSIEDFVMAMIKREFNNPAGGVRNLAADEVIPWLRDVVRDLQLASAVEAVYKNCESMAEIMDTLRTVLYVRMNQYNEVIKDNEQ